MRHHRAKAIDFLSSPFQAPTYRTATAGLVAWYLLVVVVLGIREQGDATVFIAWADTFLRVGGDLEAYFSEIKKLRSAADFPTGNDLPYIGVVALLAGLKFLLGEAWRTGFVLINIAAISLASGIWLLLAKLAKFSTAAAILGTILLAVNWEFVHWTAYVGTNILFQPLAAFVFLTTAIACLIDKSKVRASLYLVCISLAAASVAVRPAGLWLIAFVLLAILTRGWIVANDHAERRKRGQRLLLLGLILAVIGIIVGSFLMDDPSRVGNDILAETIAHYGQYNSNGEVIRDRPETFLAPPTGPLDYTKLILLKLVYYFAPAAADFSTSHYIFNCVFFGIYYALALSGGVALFHRSGQLDRSAHALAILAILFLSVFAMAHALTIIDYDWRYRIPCYGPLTLLAMIGADVYLLPIIQNKWVRR